VFNVSSGHIYVGEGTKFGHDVMLLTGTRLAPNKQITEDVPNNGHDIHIGRHCWIASGAIIVGGVTIGDNCVAAAGAIVSRSFPDNSFIVGCPATRRTERAHATRKPDWKSFYGEIES
jgi:maltose O-acetyltransferase